MTPQVSMADRPACGKTRETEEEIEVTPEMIEAGLMVVWPEPKSPKFVRDQVVKIYIAMEQERRICR